MYIYSPPGGGESSIPPSYSSSILPSRGRGKQGTVFIPPGGLYSHALVVICIRSNRALFSVLKVDKLSEMFAHRPHLYTSIPKLFDNIQNLYKHTGNTTMLSMSLLVAVAGARPRASEVIMGPMVICSITHWLEPPMGTGGLHGSLLGQLLLYTFFITSGPTADLPGIVSVQ